MRKFFVIAAALVVASAGLTAATLQSGPPGVGDQQAECVAGRGRRGWSHDALELADDQAPGIRKLAIMPGRGVELGVTIRDLDSRSGEDGQRRRGRGRARRQRRREGGHPKGDVIVEFDGERVRGQRHLSRLVSETPEGRTVKAAVMRDGKRVDLSVTPGDRRARGRIRLRVLRSWPRSHAGNAARGLPILLRTSRGCSRSSAATASSCRAAAAWASASSR